MTRRSSLLVCVSLLLVACASTKPRPMVVEDDSDVVYLVGQTSRYSVSMDELRPEGPAERRARLPHALVAGDENLTVAASLFHQGDIYALDLIVHNEGNHAIEIDRSRIELMDDDGLHFHALYDWEDGADYGLRSVHELNRGYAHLGTDFEESGPPAGDKAPKASSGKKSARSPLDAQQANRMGENANLNDFSWISELQMEDETLLLPARVDIEPKGNAPYWAYWRAKRPDFPLTAVVVIDGKRMLFRFEEP